MEDYIHNLLSYNRKLCLTNINVKKTKQTQMDNILGDEEMTSPIWLTSPSKPLPKADDECDGLTPTGNEPTVASCPYNEESATQEHVDDKQML